MRLGSAADAAPPAPALDLTALFPDGGHPAAAMLAVSPFA